MASKSKRRKLTIPDMDDFESRTKSVNKAIADFKSASEAIMAISLEDIRPRALESMTEHQVVLLLVCKFGVDLVCKATSESSDLPINAPPHVKRKYRECNGLDGPECNRMMEVLSSRCHSSDSTPRSASRSSLATSTLLLPPTGKCIQCNKTLVSNHTCKAKLYTFEGAMEKEKMTLRCNECSLIYNYSQYGNKHGVGFRYYENQRDYVEVNDCVFFDRRLLEFQCCLANHAWVSFQGFAESYNDTFNLPHKQEVTPTMAADAFYNGELEHELRQIGMLEYAFKSDSDRETCMEAVEQHRVRSIYRHAPEDCSPDCARRGCGKLWVTDGIWKIMYPHCMFHIQQAVPGFPLLNMPDVCTASPLHKQAFCSEHCQLLQSQSPPIPTELHAFIEFCKQRTSKDSVTPEDVDKVVSELTPNTTTQTGGQSAAESQGTSALLNQHPQLGSEAVVDNPESMCRKDTGSTKKLRRWSRGHQFIVRGGGHIDTWQPLYKSESPCQVFLIIINWLLAICREAKASVLPRIVLAYDNMCNLCRLRITKSPLPLPPPLDQLWESVDKIIDKFHLSNHVSQECQTKFSPEKIKQENRYFNTQAGEQTFVWVSRFRHILCAMNKTHHLFYLHRMVRRRNNYTSKCYKHHRKPVLPNVTRIDSN